MASALRIRAFSPTPPARVTLRALVLGGGNALGAYLAGAYEALQVAGEYPAWIAGSSIGAITGAIIAGNPPEACVEHLRQ